MVIKVSKYFLIIFLLIVTRTLLTGQNTMYFHKDLPQSALLNPVFASSCNYIGIPIVSSFYLNYDNTAFSYNQLFPKSSSGSRVIDINYMADKMHNLDLISTEVNTNLFSLGVWYKDYYFNFNIAEKTGLWATFPGSLADLAWDGNTQYVGETFEATRLGMRFSYYREYSLSATGWLSDDWKMGVRPKLLFGKLNLDTRNEKLQLNTENENFDLNISATYEAYSSFPLELQKDSEGNISSVSLGKINYMDLLMNGQNPGFAFDFGVLHDYSENIDFYASLIDLGIIRWRSNLNSINVAQSIEYTGVTQEEIEYGYNIQDVVDSLGNSWQTETSQKPYTTFLPVKLYAGLTYSLNSKTDLGFLNRTLYFKRRLYPSFTISYNAEFFDFLSVTASYSYRDYAFDNIGAGISLQSNTAQFYLITDNILAISPLSVRNLNFRFGVNLFFNCGSSSSASRRPSIDSYKGCFWIRKEQKQRELKKGLK